jgi:HPt (histidine-containing phosphotransfer) domain-containing protein
VSDTLEQLKIFDMQDGLQRIGGSRELMVELLESFDHDFAHTMIEYDQFMEEGDCESARRLIHSVKGAAGNLGAYKLHLSAAFVEEALKNNHMAEVQERLPQLGRLMDEAIGDIHQAGINRSSDNREAMEEGSMTLLRDLLIDFHDYAETKKIRLAREKFKEIRRYSWPVPTEEDLKTIEDQVKLYELRKAALGAEKLIGELRGL